MSTQKDILFNKIRRHPPTDLPGSRTAHYRVTTGNVRRSVPTPHRGSAILPILSILVAAIKKNHLNSSISNRWLRDKLEMEKPLRRKLQKSSQTSKHSPPLSLCNRERPSFPLHVLARLLHTFGPGQTLAS